VPLRFVETQKFSIARISTPMHRTQHGSEAPRYGYCL
jgi:hypothetical protein